VALENKDNDRERRGREYHLQPRADDRPPPPSAYIYICIYIYIYGVCIYTYIYVCMYWCVYICMRASRSYIAAETTHSRFDASTPRQAARQLNRPAANHPVDRIITTARLTPTGYASLMVLVPLPAVAPTAAYIFAVTATIGPFRDMYFHNFSLNVRKSVRHRESLSCFVVQTDS
jgi:hypothetical protein